MLPNLSRRHLLAGVSVFALSICPVFTIACADPLPVDPTIRHGDISIQDSPGGNMIIDQSGAKGVIDWDTFNIAAGRQVNFKQPSAAAITVNRVTGSSPSDILGTLSASGRIILSNPNGILFGQNALIDVAGMIATTGRVDITDFINQDKIHVTDIADGGSIDIHGQVKITPSQAGLAAFIAPHITHHESGFIRAKTGQVTLSTGPAATIDFSGGFIEIALDGDTTDLTDSRITLNGDIDATDGQVIISTATAKRTIDDVINTNHLAEAIMAARNGDTIILSDGGTIDMAGSAITAEQLITLTEKLVIKPDTPPAIEADKWTNLQRNITIDSGLANVINTQMSEAEEEVEVKVLPCRRNGCRTTTETQKVPPNLQTILLMASQDLILQSDLVVHPGDQSSSINLYAGRSADLSGHEIDAVNTDLSLFTPMAWLSPTLPQMTLSGLDGNLTIRADQLPGNLTAISDKIIWDRRGYGDLSIHDGDIGALNTGDLSIGMDFVDHLNVNGDLTGYDQLALRSNNLNVQDHNITTDRLTVLADDVSLSNGATVQTGDSIIGRYTAGDMMIGPDHWVGRLAGDVTTGVGPNINELYIDNANLDLPGAVDFVAAQDVVMDGVNTIPGDGLSIHAGGNMVWQDNASLNLSDAGTIKLSGDGDWIMPMASQLTLGKAKYEFQFDGDWALGGQNLHRTAGLDFDIANANSGFDNISTAIHAIAPSSGPTTLNLASDEFLDHGIQINQGEFAIHGNDGRIIGSNGQDGIRLNGGKLELQDIGLSGYDTALAINGGDIDLNSVNFIDNDTAIALGLGQDDMQLSDLGSNITINGMDLFAPLDITDNFDDLLGLENTLYHASDQFGLGRILFHDADHWIADAGMDLSVIMRQMGAGHTLNLAEGHGYDLSGLTNMPSGITITGRGGYAQFAGDQLVIDADQLIIDHLAFSDITDGIQFNATDGLTIRDSRFDNAPLTISNSIGSINIAGNQFSGQGLGHGIKMIQADGPITKNGDGEMITNNQFSTLGTAISLDQSDHITIGKNSIQNVIHAVVIDGGTSNRVIGRLDQAAWTHSGEGIIIRNSDDTVVDNISLSGDGTSTGVLIDGDLSDTVYLSDLLISDQDTGIHITGGNISVGGSDTKMTITDGNMGVLMDGNAIELDGRHLNQWSFNNISDQYIRLANKAFYLDELPVVLDATQTDFDGRRPMDRDFEEFNELLKKIDDFKQFGDQELGIIDLGEMPANPISPPPAPDNDNGKVDNNGDIDNLPDFEEPGTIVVINEAFRMPRKYSAWAEDISTPPANNVTEMRIGDNLNDIAPASGNQLVTCQSGGYAVGGQVTFGPMPICN